jgi:hypothetical protein
MSLVESLVAGAALCHLIPIVLRMAGRSSLALSLWLRDAQIIEYIDCVLSVDSVVKGVGG